MREDYRRNPDPSKRWKDWGDQPEVTRLDVANPLGRDPIQVPEEVWFEAGPPGPARIGWRAGGDRVSPPLHRCLDEFTRLAGAPDQAVVRIAGRWGALGICEHGKPHLHNNSRDGCCWPLSEDHRAWERREIQLEWLRHHAVDMDNPYRYRAPHWEPLAAWRMYAHAFRAILNLAHDVRNGRATRPEDWRDGFTGRIEWLRSHGGAADAAAPADASAWDPPVGWDLRSPWFNPSPDQRRTVLSYLVNGLLWEAGMVPSLMWADETPWVGLTIGVPVRRQAGDVEWPATRLFAVLACQLTAAVASSSGVVRCSVCDRAYPRSPDRRAIRGDRRNFCGDDCRAEARKSTDRESWHRRKPNRQRCPSDPAADGSDILGIDDRSRSARESGARSAQPSTATDTAKPAAAGGPRRTRRHENP